MQREMADRKRENGRRGRKPKAVGTKDNRKIRRKRCLLRSRSSLAEPADGAGSDGMGELDEDVEKCEDPAEKPKGVPKAKAKASGKAKAKAKGLPKAKAKAKRLPKAKAKALAKKSDEPKSKGKGKPKAKAKAAADDVEDPAEPEEIETLGSSVRQRRIDLGGRRWVYEVLPDQTLGCAGCRLLFGGCIACRKEGFRGKTAQAFAQTHEYVVALSWLDDADAPQTEIGEGSSKKRKRKAKASA